MREEILKVVGQEPGLSGAADAGVVEHDVEAAEAVNREIYERLDLIVTSLTSVCLKALPRRRCSRPAPGLRPRRRVADHDARTPSLTNSSAVAQADHRLRRR